MRTAEISSENKESSTSTKTGRMSLGTNSHGMNMKDLLPTTSRGNKYILVISVYFTSYSEAYPLENQEAETVGGILCS